MFAPRFLFASMAVATAIACEPSVGTTTPTSVDYGVVDLQATPPSIPFPNDLALTQQGIAGQSGAIQELLSTFAAAGGFPDDQELPIAIDFKHITGLSSSAPNLDLTTFGATTLAAIEVPPSGTPRPMSLDPIQPTDYAQLSDRGRLTLHNSLHTVMNASGSAFMSRRWNAGSTYIVAVRGGPNGVKTKGGGTLTQQPVPYLLTLGQSLTDLANRGLLPLPGTPEQKLAAAAQLEAIRQQYIQGHVFDLVEQAWGVGTLAGELVTIQTFHVVAAPSPHVETDGSTCRSGAPCPLTATAPVAGNLPLPSDFLLDPISGHVESIPNFCGGVFDETSPSPSCPLSRGLATLDGFTTTGPLFSPVSAPIQASTANSSNVLLYALTAAGPVRVVDFAESSRASPPFSISPGYLAEPPQLAQAPTGGACAASATNCVSTVVALQPAVLVPAGTTAIALPPLQEGTEYAVVITSGISDTSGKPLARSTLGQIVLFQDPIANLKTGTSLLPGVPDSQAVALENMRLALQPVVKQAQSDGKIASASQVAMAYTLRTQSITGKGNIANPSAPAGALEFAVAPYTQVLPGICQALGAQIGSSTLDCTKPLPGQTKPIAISDAFDKYGIQTAGGVPTASIGSILETQIATINALSDATGAFDPNPANWRPEVIDVLIAVPAATNSNVPTCAGALAALAPGKCMPLVVFQHGMDRSRADMLLVANALNAAGIAVAAIDLPKHGSRSLCSASNQCAQGSCVPDQALAGQGDAVAPGQCTTGTGGAGILANQPTLCFTPPCTFIASNAGFPIASGNFFVSPNFFRSRDSIRQAIIDQAQLIQVMAPTPTGPTIAGHDVYNMLAAQGLFVNPSPATTGYLSPSLGSMVGTISAAVDPRISRAVLNTNGGTLFDVFTNSPALKPQVDVLFSELGVPDRTATDPATQSRLLQIASVAKWILDPADPINFAGHLQEDPLPNLLPPIGGAADGSVRQGAKGVLAQIATCDQTVPNPFNELAAGDIGLNPVPPSVAGSGTVQWFQDRNAPQIPAVYPGSGCAAGMRVSHTFLFDFGAALPLGAPLSPGSLDAASSASLTSSAQSSAASFLLTGANQSTLVTQ